MARVPSTPALRLLRERGVPHVVHTYPYVERGGARASSAALGFDLHRIVKTLVFEDDRKEPLIVLMHGDREVSTKQLARHLGRKAVAPCAPPTAERHSGYRTGGTSPFGTRRAMRVYVERTILDLDRILINGGARGVLVEIAPQVLVDVLDADPVQVAV
jgi:Cys-tRNA(Pro) deacylase